MREQITMASMALAMPLGVATPAWVDGTTEPVREAQAGTKGAASITSRPVHASGLSG